MQANKWSIFLMFSAGDVEILRNVSVEICQTFIRGPMNERKKEVLRRRLRGFKSSVFVFLKSTEVRGTKNKKKIQMLRKR